MSGIFPSPPPKAWSRLCETVANVGSAADLDLPLGELCRVLAAARPGGVFLCLGSGAGGIGAWILDGMDLSSRLVIVAGGDDEADLLRSVLGDDLRVTVHVQDAAGFLGDVHEHRFDLVADLCPGPPAAATRLALGALAPGGFCVTRHDIAELAKMLSAEAPGSESIPRVDPLVSTGLPLESGVTLVVRGPPEVRTTRRGGRRSRQGVTPLFSSRPRGGGRSGGH
jgi:hypothetical protein